MSWLTRLLNADRPQTPLPEITRNSSSWGDIFRSINGLPVVNEQTALQISAVYACVNLIAGTIAALPFNLYKRTPDGERAQLQNDDLWWIFNEQFSPRWSAANGWEYMVQALLLQGDGFAVILRNANGVPQGLDPVHPSRVRVVATADGQRLIYAITTNQMQGGQPIVRVYDQDDMLHFAGFGFDGLRGRSPLKHHLSMSGAVALAAQEYSARFFANSARPDVVLTSDQALNQEMADMIRDRWEQLYGGLGHAHRPAVLGQGMKVEPITVSAEDAQLIATRQFQIEEVARAYGVPPFMIGHTEKTTSWGSGVEAMGIGFVRFTLKQHLNKIQNEVNRKFFRTATRFAEFDTFDLEKADMKTLFDSFRIALGRAGEPGFMTQDEVRMKLNLRRAPGGNSLAKGSNSNEPQPASEPSGK